MMDEEKERMETLKRLLFMRLLEKEARQRLDNIRIANPPFAEQLEAVLLQYAQKSGGKKIGEETLIKIAKAARGQQPETRIRRM